MLKWWTKETRVSPNAKDVVHHLITTNNWESRKSSNFVSNPSFVLHILFLCFNSITNSVLHALHTFFQPRPSSCGSLKTKLSTILKDY
jgi:hypothetical protein